jgi:hypothetical protein
MIILFYINLIKFELFDSSGRESCILFRIEGVYALIFFPLHNELIWYLPLKS